MGEMMWQSTPRDQCLTFFTRLMNRPTWPMPLPIVHALESMKMMPDVHNKEEVTKCDMHVCTQLKAISLNKISGMAKPLASRSSTQKDEGKL